MPSLRPPNAFGPYDILGRISAGGMAHVFLARHRERGTLVALKRILPHIAEDEEFTAMFEDEARITSRLEHPYIARVLDFGNVKGEYYIAFEYVDGRDMRRLFDRAEKIGQPIPLRILLYIFERLGEGLAYAHARKDDAGHLVGLVHRDVSPQNIMVSFDGDVKLIDFGIAKAAGKISRTSAGSIKGKFGYMSPEQLTGGSIDARSDIFSFGICLWELLTQKRLFTAQNELLVLAQIKSFVPKSPSEAGRFVPGALDKIVLKALAKDADERYRAARDLYRDLHACAENAGEVATREEVATYMRQAFPESSPDAANDTSKNLPLNSADLKDEVFAPPSKPKIDDAKKPLGSQGKSQETRTMSENDNKMSGGSDLDIFEGLGKKSTGRISATPPPPSRSVPPAPPSRAPESLPKKTLMGIASVPPPPSSNLQAAVPAPAPSRSAPPPPPGRASLPNVVPPPRRASVSGFPTAPQTRPASVPVKAAAPQPGLDMDWDDEDEATHVFDKEEKSSASVRAHVPANGGIPKGTLVGMNAPPAPPPSSQAYRASQPPFRSAPPPPNSQPPMRTSSLPPPPSQQAFARASGMPSAVRGPSVPPPSPELPGTAPIPTHAGQGNTAPLPMPVPMPRVPSFAPSPMEATAMVRPQERNWLPFLGGAVAVLAVAAGVLVYATSNKTGRVVVNVTDTKGAAINHLEIFIDGKKWCDTAPCTVDQVTSGSHQIKVLADGYDVTPPRDLNVESRKEANSIDFTLAATSKSGTGLRVAGNQPGVKLYVDGQDDGTLPQELKSLTPGDHKIRIAGSERYEALEKNVIVANNEMQDLGTIALKVLKGKATISLNTPGAKVYIVSGSDRRELPTLPISVDIDTAKGQWSLEAVKPGFNDYRQTISFDDGQAEKTFAITLDPKTSSSSSNATASTHDTSSQTTSAAAPVEHVDHTPKSTPAPAPQAAAANTDSAASASEGFLNINSIPASSVVLDGKPLGNTPKLHISVSPGSHTVTFINSDQGLKKQISVSVGAGETKVAVAKLRE